MQIVPSLPPVKFENTHIYNATVSAVKPAAIAEWVNGLPERFKNSLYGTVTAEVTGSDAGSTRVSFYIMTPSTANALRKRFARKFGGRAKFARLVTR